MQIFKNRTFLEQPKNTMEETYHNTPESSTLHQADHLGIPSSGSVVCDWRYELSLYHPIHAV